MKKMTRQEKFEEIRASLKETTEHGDKVLKDLKPEANPVNPQDREEFLTNTTNWILDQLIKSGEFKE